MKIDKSKTDKPDTGFVPITKKLREIGSGISLPAIKRLKSSRKRSVENIIISEGDLSTSPSEIKPS